MFQPFIALEKIFVDRLMSMNKIYLVSQTYHRGTNPFDEETRQGILLSDYDNPGLAIMHLNALKADKFAALIDLSKQVHYHQLITKLGSNKYRFYWAMTKNAHDLQKRIGTRYKARISRYAKEKTNWNISTTDPLRTQFEVTFGEIFLVLKWRSQKVRIKFEEIETY